MTKLTLGLFSRKTILGTFEKYISGPKTFQEFWGTESSVGGDFGTDWDRAG